MKLRFIVSELYNYFDCKFYNKDFRIVKLKNDYLITDFLINVHKDYNLQSIDYQFIFKYLVCQYDYWKAIKVKGFGNTTRVANIFGQKAYNRFKERNDNPKFNWYNAENLLKQQYGISSSFLLRYRAREKKDLTQLSVDEEKEKTLFEDHNVQLVHCIDSTTLFNHNSNHCIKCGARQQCKQMLKQYYREIYIDRGYETSVEEEAKI